MIRSTPTVIGVVTALALSACAPTEDTAGPSTSDSSSSKSTTAASGSPSSTGESSTTTEAVDGPADQQLSLKEAKAALPKLSQLPEGYLKESAEQEGRGGDDRAEVQSTDPEHCAIVLFSDRKSTKYDNDHMVAYASTEYALPDGGKLRGNIIVRVSSFDEPYPQAFFDRVRTTLSKCASFDAESTITTRAMRSPDVGDDTLAFHLGHSAFGKPRDWLFVRSGHNLISLAVRSDLPDYDESQLKDIATIVLDNLKE